MPITKKASKKVANAIALKKARKKVTQEGAPTPVKKTAAAKPTKAMKTVKKAVKTSKATSAPQTMKRKRKNTLPTGDFNPDTDMYVAFQEALAGGDSRTDVTRRLASKWEGVTTRNDKPKPVSTIMNHVVRRALANGYRVEQYWRLVKDDSAKSAAKKSGRRAAAEQALANAQINTKTSKKAVKRRAKP